MRNHRATVPAIGLALLALHAVPARAGDKDDPTDVPIDLQVPADQKLALDAIGKGYQVYECKGNLPVPTSASWVFLYPEADLLDPNDFDSVLGTHYAGPTWKANDTSTVVAAVLKKVPAPDPGDIPWLKLGATAHTGDGDFSRVTFIQRLDTFGGVAPPACACDLDQIGTVARVPYTAHYYFYVPHDHGK